MKKVVLILLILLVSCTSFVSANSNGFGINIGYGGALDCFSFGAEYTAIVEQTVEAKGKSIRADLAMTPGIYYIPPFDFPSDILNYSAPHDDWEVDGYAEEEFGLYLGIGVPVYKNIWCNFVSGGGLKTKTTIQKSNATGWTYKGDKESSFTLLLGAGLIYDLGNSGIEVRYDTRRGIVAGYNIAW